MGLKTKNTNFSSLVPKKFKKKYLKKFSGIYNDPKKLFLGVKKFSKICWLRLEPSFNFNKNLKQLSTMCQIRGLPVHGS
jgi:hypothetical protein